MLFEAECKKGSSTKINIDKKALQGDGEICSKTNRLIETRTCRINDYS